MKTIIKDLTGEMPVDDIDKKLDAMCDIYLTISPHTRVKLKAAIKSLFDKPKGKPIEFVKSIQRDGSASIPMLKPSEMRSITLLCRNYGGGLDAMLAEGMKGTYLLYLGHWNGGFVENNDNS